MKSRLLKILAGISLIGLFAINGGLAPSISINTNNKVEFGQGSILTVTCDQNIEVSLTSRVDPITGNFWVDKVTVSDLSVQLNNRTLTISLRGFDNGELNKVPIKFSVASDGTTFTSSRQHNDFVNSTSNGSGPKAEKGASSIVFTNFFNEEPSPIISSDIKNITMETNGGDKCSVPTCATGATCALGDIGPGGGPVFYAPASPFSVASTGKLYRYIEAAPANWYSGVVDPKTQVCTSYSIASELSVNIGSAKTNTDVFIAQSSCNRAASGTTPSGLNTAASLVRTYGADWQLPTLNEVLQLCKLARFGAVVAPTKANCNDSGGAAPTSGFFADEYATSSKNAGAGFATKVNFNNGLTYANGIQTSVMYVRPIRYIE